MKKQLVLVAGLAVLATPAFASKARLQALGEDVNGSFYINDNRNIFLNAVEVNNHKDLVTYEWGGAAAADGSGSPRAEGGFYRSAGNLNYGAQLGRRTSFDNALEESGDTIIGTAPTNNVELFVGGDAGIKWGTSLSYATAKDDSNDEKASAMDLAVGLSQGNVSGFARVGLGGKAENDTDEQELKSSIDLGASYMMNDLKFFGRYTTFKFESDTLAEDHESRRIELGVGRGHKLNDKATLFTRAAVVNENFTADATADDEKTKRTTLPVVIGLEFDATSWLTLRGSVGQAIWSSEETDGDKKTVANSTVVNAGASLKFGDLTVDGVIGNNNNGTTPGDSTANGDGQLRTDSLMSRVSVTYRF